MREPTTAEPLDLAAQEAAGTQAPEAAREEAEQQTREAAALVHLHREPLIPTRQAQAALASSSFATSEDSAVQVEQ